MHILICRVFSLWLLIPVQIEIDFNLLFNVGLFYCRSYSIFLDSNSIIIKRSQSILTLLIYYASAIVRSMDRLTLNEGSLL
ncbi:hypothetical protein FGO68_gene1565 [Halteria grandinella]|uniref:Uncharacterized protein n=1 Tax=Halteria grandinella TaxID=5974 RepID=A0A8J8NHN6_HALGN|nr:hypothetical protein FGO68_gene1565 [Halteria grandinella]